MKIFSDPKASEPFTLQSLTASALISAAFVYGPFLSIAFIKSFDQNVNLIRPETFALMTALWCITALLLWSLFSLEIKDKRGREALFKSISTNSQAIADAYLVDTVAGKTVLVVKTNDGKKT